MSGDDGGKEGGKEGGQQEGGASRRPFVLPVAVHDANAIPSPLLDVYVNDVWSMVCIHINTGWKGSPVIGHVHSVHDRYEAR